MKTRKVLIQSQILYSNQTSRILDTNLDQNDHYEALKFLLHFIGDIHQPLHTEAEDRGGNGIQVLFNKKHTNLHSIWDTEILEKYAGSGDKADEKSDATNWANALDGRRRTARHDGTRTRAIVLAECSDVQDAQGCALAWATEANSYICSYVLKDDVEGVEGRNLATDYYDGAVPIVDYLIGKAGVRLAAWLNALAAAAQQQTQPKLIFQNEDRWESVEEGHEVL